MPSMRSLLLVGILCCQLSSTASAQSEELARDDQGAWAMLGARNPMTDATRWFLFMFTRSFREGTAAAPRFLEYGGELRVNCARDSVSFDFRPQGGSSAQRGDSVRVQMRFDNAPALPPWHFHTSGEYVRLTGAPLDRFVSLARQHREVLMLVQADSLWASVNRFSLTGFTALYSRCLARGRRTT